MAGDTWGNGNSPFHAVGTGAAFGLGKALGTRAQPSTPPGWYWDPADWASLRWWDGWNWGPSHHPDALERFRGAGRMLAPERQERPFLGIDWGRQIRGMIGMAVILGVISLVTPVGAFALAPLILFLPFIPLLAFGGLLVGSVLTYRYFARWMRLKDWPANSPISAVLGPGEVTGRLYPAIPGTRAWLSDLDAAWAETHLTGSISASMSRPRAVYGWAELRDDSRGVVLVPLGAWLSQLREAAPVVAVTQRSTICREMVLRAGMEVTLYGHVTTTPGSDSLQILPEGEGTGIHLWDADTARHEVFRKARKNLVGTIICAAILWAILGGQWGLHGVYTALSVTAAVGALVWLLVSWNRLVAIRSRIGWCWSTIDVFVQRGRRLVEDLQAVAEGAARHEQQVLETVSRIPRPAEVLAQGEQARADAALAYQWRLHVESDAHLATNQAFGVVFSERARCEDQIAGARETYNDALGIARDRVSSFPGLILARLVLRDIPPYFEPQVP